MAPPVSARGPVLTPAPGPEGAPGNQDLERVEDFLRRAIGAAGNRQAAALGRELAFAGGKRLRPRLFLLSFRASASFDPPPHVYRLAAALELLHLATLVHDDVIDGATVRRSRPSLNAMHGERAAVLIGDFFFSQFLQAAAPSGPRALALLSATISRMVEGELEQARHRFDLSLSEAQYLRIIAKKTAAFLAAACELGALVAGAGQKERRLFQRFGRYLGCAFQLQDDILDYVGDPLLLGKPRGSDLAEGVVTLPLIYALKCGRRAARVRSLLAGFPPGPGELEAVRVEVEKAGGIAYARARANEFLRRALAELTVLPPGPARAEFEGLVWSLERREK
ncbi:MAG: heptaprenyl diphosphate synthase component 2 [Bacillota bacterium]|nr:heptaprenyl diphosphate synthase component 2 [Bacillota bacterium]MDK2924621.1 heptaprenyl diphosphate synthase component 2 [Bacillota bacterium]